MSHGQIGFSIEYIELYIDRWDARGKWPKNQWKWILTLKTHTCMLCIQLFNSNNVFFVHSHHPM